MAEKDIDQVGKLTEEQRTIGRIRLNAISPDDGKYGKSADALRPYLSAEAEWRACAYIQELLLETRMEFGQASQKNVDEVKAALEKIDPLNMALLEDNVTRHDQLAVLEELGRFVSPETKALLHPGTTSYDVLDTARSLLLKRAWANVMSLEIAHSLNSLSDLAVRSLGRLQVGRTHLQSTSPVTFGGVIAGYAGRLAERTERCDLYFKDLRGKISGIVGTGASIDMVVGEGRSLEFEKAVLAKLGLQPDYTATQIVQKERLTDVGHGLVTLMHVLGDFANDMRMLYSTAIREVVSRDNSQRLGGSSADAGKDNPIDWENIAGKVPVVESGMRVLYAMIQTDFQRDLRGSVQARYQPNGMMAEVFESFQRLNRKCLPNLSVNEDMMDHNLEYVRKNPSEAMTAILRGQQWTHSSYGIGHDFVKKMMQQAKKEGIGLLEQSRADPEFNQLFESLPETQKAILSGKLENYIGSAGQRVEANIDYARRIASGQV